MFIQAWFKAEKTPNHVDVQIYYGVLYRKRPKGRQAKTWSGEKKQDSNSKKYEKSAREPWLLVSNLPQKDWPASRIVGLYSTRMQIEEGFRDTKSTRYGLSLALCGSRDCARLEVLLMIAMLLHFVLMLVGRAAYLKGYHKDFQANTVKDRKVLSDFYLGKEVLRHPRYELGLRELLLGFAGMKANSEAGLY